MPKSYKSISELYQEVVATKIIDLVPYVVGLPSALLDMLADSPTGLYLPGNFTPTFYSDLTYTLVEARHQTSNNKVTIKDIEKDIAGTKRLPRGHLADHETRFFMDRLSYERVKKHLSRSSKIPVKGCEAAVTFVVAYLNTLNRLTNVYPGRFAFNRILRPDVDFSSSRFDDEFEKAFYALRDDVASFVGNDTWSTYNIKVEGTTLVIEKGLDYRIIDFHKREIESSDNYDGWTGRIYERTEAGINA